MIKNNFFILQMTILLDHGANVNALNYRDQSALTLGTINNKYEVVRLLIQKKAKLNEMDVQGLTPLCYALNYQNKTILQLLLENGAKIHQINSLLQECLKRSQTDIAKILIDAGINVNFRINGKETPLHSAINNCDDYEIVEYLIKNGAKIGCTLEYDLKEIHLLMERTNLEHNITIRMLSLFYECGVDLNELSGYKKTPLEITFNSRNYSNTVILIREGASVHLGCTPFIIDKLREINCVQLIKLIGEYFLSRFQFPITVLIPSFSFFFSLRRL